MTNILIVDNVLEDRIKIRLLLEELSNITISEATNAQEAIEICKKEHLDIIFMDIMMPNIDSIAAIKTIKSLDKKIMILALSYIDDEATKNKILESGAEDYIRKPIEDAIFHQRFKNYIQIIEFRKEKLSNIFAANHFTQEIYSRSLKFQITTLQSLAEFWDYYLNNGVKNIQTLKDCIRIIYAYGQLCVKLDLAFVINVEENDDNLFMTLSQLDVINELVIQHTLLKHYKDAIFILKNNKLSFRLPKSRQISKDDIVKSDLDDYQDSILSKTHFNKTPAIEYVNNTAVSLIEKVEDLGDIQYHLESAAINFEKNITKENLLIITEFINSYIEVLDQLLEFEHFAYALTKLNAFFISLELSEVDDKEQKKFALLFIHLLDDINEWRNNIFIKKEANDIHYLDSSLLSSCIQIESILEKKDILGDEENNFELF